MASDTLFEQQPTVTSYGIQVIREALNKMLSLADDVRKAEDIEAIHDMRVASRRLRAAIQVFSPLFASKEFARFDRDVKAVTKELGAARDLDVMIDALEKMETTLPLHEHAGIDGFVRERRARREKLQRTVLKALDRMESRNLTIQFQRIADTAVDMFDSGSVQDAAADGREIQAQMAMEARG